VAHWGVQQNGGGCETAVAGAVPDAQPRATLLLALLQQGAGPAACPHCGDRRIYGWGRCNSGRQRHGCRGCGRTFSAATGTAAHGVHDLAKLQALLTEMLDGATRSCRALAAELEVGKNTVWRWRSKIMTALRKLDAPPAERVIVAQLHIVRDSRKASREWVRHATDPLTWPAPDRPRWIDVDSGRLPEPMPRAKYRVPLLAVMDEIHGRRAMLWAKQGIGGLIPPDDNASSIDVADLTLSCLVDHEIAPRHARECRANTTHRQLSPDDRGGCNAANRLPPGEALRHFLRPFRGPATKHLRGYLAWFNAAQTGAALHPHDPASAMLLSFRPTRYGDMPVAPP
jgi:transposase-like protein